MEQFIGKKFNLKKVLIVIIILMIVIIAAVATIVILKNKSQLIDTSAEPENENVENSVASEENVIDTNTIQAPVKDEGWKVEKTKGVIYLTFDDGPSLDITPQILDILKEENVKATFFVINYSSNKEALVKREVEEGHSIGIHGYSHKYKEIYVSEDVYMENVNKMQSKIEETTGVKTTITRFPGGSSNTISKFNKGIMTRLTKKVEEAGYKYYDWNVDSDDAGSAKNKNQVYNNVTKNLSLERSNVVLMHDFSNNTKTLDALKDIIEYGKSNGYEFKKITADSSLTMHHKIYN
jgi:peptidoglycan/xylan/chitin deacetylase (PgdA/CDA1 family)